MITNLPNKKPFIGTKVIVNNIKKGKIKTVVIAKNCPGFLIEKIQNSGKVTIETFKGNENDLGTKVGKPFPVAAVGYE